jgi:iron(III) transport system substrate-binding protein
MFIQKIARWGLLSWSCWVGLVLSEGPVSGVVPPSSGHEQIFLNRAQDRLVSTLEKAKKEGTLTLYTSMAPSEIGPLVKEFEKKYALKVEVWRSTSEGILQRALNESKAKKFN